MKVKEITVTYGRKINLGNYQSATIEITLIGSIEDIETNPDDFSSESGEVDRLQTLARDAVHAEILRLPRTVDGPSIVRPPAVPGGTQKPSQSIPEHVPPFQPTYGPPLF